MLVGALAACQGAKPTTSTLPSATSSQASTPPSPSSSLAMNARPSTSSATPATSTAQPVVLPPDTFATVVTDGLRVRTEPFVGAASRKLEPLLWQDAVLFVIDGPVAGSGYDWYLVDPLSEVDLQVHPDPPPPGWVAAASRDGEPWLAPFAVHCPETLLASLKSEFVYPPVGLSGLACLGDRTLRFTAYYSSRSREGCLATTGPWRIDPSWLAPCQEREYRLADPTANLPEAVNTLDVTIEPSVDLRDLPDLAPDHWLLVDVAGQFAHPAADDCHAVPTGGDGEGPPRSEMVVLDCRAQFVVTSIKSHFDT